MRTHKIHEAWQIFKVLLTVDRWAVLALDKQFKYIHFPFVPSHVKYWGSNTELASLVSMKTQTKPFGCKSRIHETTKQTQNHSLTHLTLYQYECSVTVSCVEVGSFWSPNSTHISPTITGSGIDNSDIAVHTPNTSALIGGNSRV